MDCSIFHMLIDPRMKEKRLQQDKKIPRLEKIIKGLET